MSMANGKVLQLEEITSPISAKDFMKKKAKNKTQDNSQYDDTHYWTKDKKKR